jgi:hypothetical protein
VKEWPIRLPRAVSATFGQESSALMRCSRAYVAPRTMTMPDTSHGDRRHLICGFREAKVIGSQKVRKGARRTDLCPVSLDLAK